MSSASGPRTSPTTIRSGRIRSALRTSRRIVTSPRPSRFGGRASSRTTCGWRSRSSAASSIVTTRSPAPMNADSALSVVVLPEPVPPQTRRLARARTARARKSSSGRVSVPLATSSSGVKPAAAEAADRQDRAVERQRRDHDVHARAVGQPRVAQRLGLVDAPAERREDALDRVAQVALVGEAHAGALEPPAALDPHRRRAADHDLVDRGVAQQRLERPEPERALGDPSGELGARVGVEHRRLAIHERADALAQVGLGAARVRRAGGRAGRRRARRGRSSRMRGARGRTSPPVTALWRGGRRPLRGRTAGGRRARAAAAGSRARTRPPPRGRPPGGP